jgi:predicted PurR-regulated permease PerM
MVPLIVGRSVGLNPVVIIFAILCGAAIGSQVGGSPAMGFLGMILAVPMANIISIFIEDYTAKHK